MFANFGMFCDAGKACSQIPHAPGGASPGGGGEGKKCMWGEWRAEEGDEVEEEKLEQESKGEGITERTDDGDG